MSSYFRFHGNQGSNFSNGLFIKMLVRDLSLFPETFSFLTLLGKKFENDVIFPPFFPLPPQSRGIIVLHDATMNFAFRVMLVCKKGSHTRFVTASCMPTGHGKQRKQQERPKCYKISRKLTKCETNVEKCREMVLICSNSIILGLFYTIIL